MLFTEAISIVLQGNQKGYSPTDLDLKLRAGYRFSAIPPEGVALRIMFCWRFLRILYEVQARLTYY
jgi:hypothetical protein